MLDLWYTENWSEETKFSIKVKEHIFRKNSFSKNRFFYIKRIWKIFYFRWFNYDY